MPKKTRRREGIVVREHHLLLQPIVNCLRHHGARPAWEIEEELAKLFHVTQAERRLIHPESRCPVWRNDVAFGLNRLVQERTILNVGKRQAPPGYGGVRSIYQLPQLDAA